jgi:nucleotide-binding universal stress UspA family protein
MSILSETHDKKEKVQIKRILVPIDGSSYSLKAAKYAIEISRLQNAQISCIHVIAKLPSSYVHAVPAIAGPAIQTYIDDIKKHAQSWFDQIIKIAESKGIRNIKTDIFTDFDSIADTIINYASNNSIELIVMGTHGRTGIAKFFLGSVANDVTQHTHCPVLLIR